MKIKLNARNIITTICEMYGKTGVISISVLFFVTVHKIKY